jgi:HSP90 family molecular chaperone
VSVEWARFMRATHPCMTLTVGSCVQESRVVRIIRKQLVKRCLDMMTDMASKGEEEYEKFWSQFGRNVKLGIVDDTENKDKLASLLRVRLLSVLHMSTSIRHTVFVFCHPSCAHQEHATHAAPVVLSFAHLAGYAKLGGQNLD